MKPTARKNIFTQLRDSFWNYPDAFLGSSGVFSGIYSFYKSIRPLSHIILFIVVFSLIGYVNYIAPKNFVRYQTEVLIEGVVIGDGTITRINPLIPTNNQLENDLTQLMYYPIIRVDNRGDVVPALAYDWDEINEREYMFKLRGDVYWHDGERFTADDVIATFGVLKALGAEEGARIQSKLIDAARKMTVSRQDDFTVTFRLEEVNPTFYEDISIGILSEHVLKDVSLSTFSWAKFNLRPIGTGPLVFNSFRDDMITLNAFADHYEGEPHIKQLQIKLFKTGDDAVEAIKNGEIHILTDPSTAVLESLEEWTHIRKIQSTSLYRRYWALYLNLKVGGPEIFQNKQVRQAISSAINRNDILSKVDSAGEEAMGPIPKTSWAYDPDVKKYDFNFERAENVLDEAGWEKKEVGGKVVRIKEDEVLRFELSYLDKKDRHVVAESIKADLEKLGVVVNLDPRNSSDLNEALVATRNFEAILYGVETPIDPDRIRLWHSEAIQYPGLNISSYETKETGAIIGQEREIERVSLIDVALENGRSTTDREDRMGTVGLDIGYAKFQEVLLEDAPVVFLYHPVFSYAAHSRVKGIDLSEMTTPEERYTSFPGWYIE